MRTFWIVATVVASCVILGVVAIGGSVALLYYYQNKEVSATRKIIERENAYTAVSMETLGAYLASHFPHQKVVLINHPLSGSEARQAMILGALKKGLNGHVTLIVESLEVPADFPDGQILIGLESMIQAKDFDAIIDKHPDAAVVLSLAGLPIDVNDMKYWSMKAGERPKLALANANIYMLRKAIAEGDVAVVLHHNPDAVAVFDPTSTFPSDPQVAFAERFLLIDQSNVEMIARKYPDLFIAEKPAQK